MENKISIIIPAYNLEQYIGATLDSVLAQTEQNLEVIVVNDGSTDGTGRVVENYAEKDNRIKVIHKANGGVTSARLRGVAEAAGEWIGFVDGDDDIEPQMYERLLENALKYKADISHCGYQMVFPNGRIDYYYNTGKIVRQDQMTGLRDLLSGVMIEPGLWNKLYHRKLFRDLLRYGRMPEDIKINEDLLMNYWLFKAAESAIFEDVCPYHYVLRKGSAATSGINEHKLRDPLRVTKILLEDVPPEVEPIVYQRLVYGLIRGATMEKRRAPELIGPYRTDCRKELKSRLMEIVTGKKCTAKVKVLAVWAAIWPASYCWVHKLYARLTGHDKKYALE